MGGGRRRCGTGGVTPDGDDGPRGEGHSKASRRQRPRGARHPCRGVRLILRATGRLLEDLQQGSETQGLCASRVVGREGVG